MKDIKFSGYYDKIDNEVKRINPVVTYKYDLSVDFNYHDWSGNEAIFDHFI